MKSFKRLHINFFLNNSRKQSLGAFMFSENKCTEYNGVQMNSEKNPEKFLTEKKVEYMYNYLQ